MPSSQFADNIIIDHDDEEKEQMLKSFFSSPLMLGNNKLECLLLALSFHLTYKAKQGLMLIFSRM